MLTFAWKSLWRDRFRFAVTVGGVAMSVLLILVMNGIFAAAQRQIALYIDRSEADIFVAQAGVRNMHMASSVLSAAAADKVRAVAGVARVEAIAYFATMLEWAGSNDMAYAIGLDPDAQMGGPWLMAGGDARPAPGEVVISDRQRRVNAPRPGDRVRVAGRELRVAGLSRETRTFGASLVFLNSQDAAGMRGPVRINYLLVRVAGGARAPDVAAAIRDQVPGVTALTRGELSASDQDMALKMGVAILRIMAAVGFAIGLAVVALTIYAATVEQIRQYGVLKALGAGPGHLFAAMLGQGLAAAVAGYAAGVTLTLAVGWLAPRLSPGLEIDLVPAYTYRLFGLILLMGALAALPPFWRIQQVDPVTVFRA